MGANNHVTVRPTNLTDRMLEVYRDKQQRKLTDFNHEPETLL